MRTSRFNEEQIIGILREQAAGAKTPEYVGGHGLSDATFYKWKAKDGGLEVSEARRLKALEDEPRRLKQLLAEAPQIAQRRMADAHQPAGAPLAQSAHRNQPIVSTTVNWDIPMKILPVRGLTQSG